MIAANQPQYVWLDGQLQFLAEAKVSVLDHGFLYGYGLMETLPAYDGVPFLLDRHLRRLRVSAQALQIPWERTDAEVRAAIAALLEANGLSRGHAYIRLTVTRGPGPMGLTGGAHEFAGPTELIVAKMLAPSQPPRPFLQGVDELRQIAAKIARVIPLLTTRRTSSETAIRTKSLQYLNSLLAHEEARALGATEGLMLTAEGLVAEGSISNLFFVKMGRLYTPSLRLGVLPGITREVVIEIATTLGIYGGEIEEGLAWLNDVDEAFTTSSISGVLPISQIAGQCLSECPGTVTLQIMESYERFLRQDILGY